MNAVLEQMGKIGIIPVVVLNDAKDAAPLAKALTKKAHSIGVPGWIVPVLYIPPTIIFLLTRWLWHLYILSVILHLYMTARFRRDEYWLSNLIDALSSPEDLEP